MASATRSGREYKCLGAHNIAEKVSKTRSGRNYSVNASEKDEVEEIGTVIIDVDSEPFFRRALEKDAQHAEEDHDDCEGRELTSAPSGLLELDTPKPTVAHSTIAEAPKTRKAKSKLRRRAKAQLKALEFPKLPPKYRPRLAVLRLCSAIEHTISDLCPEDLPVASGGWVGKRVVIDEDSSVDVDALKGRGFKDLNWDGIKPHTILDKGRRILVSLAGKPNDPDWDRIIDEASSLMTSVRKLAIQARVFKSSQMRHRRGNFFNLPTGVSFGGGSKRPGNLAHTVGEKRIITQLNANRAIKRIVGFQHASFALYAPRLYEHYRKTLALLYKHEPHLEPNFPTISPFPAMTYNLGPKTSTFEHTDAGNVACGWCGITALGKYNPKKEGKLILYDLKLMITFPPGSTIFIPSAVFRHGNTPVFLPSSFRQSITQYCAGGLFRWTNYGFRTAKTLAAVDPSGKIKKAADGDLKIKTADAMALFSTIDSLAQDRVDVLRT